MDVGKPTLSGSDCTGCSANRGESGYVPEATEHEREKEKEREHVRYIVTTLASYVQGTKK